MHLHFDSFTIEIRNPEQQKLDLCDTCLMLFLAVFFAGYL